MDERLFFYSVIGFFAGLYLFYRGFAWLRQKNMIENIPTSKIRGLAMGIAEIYGRVIPAKGKILKSPLSNKDCVYYRYAIEEYRRSGKYSSWVVINQGKDMICFFLEDKTGKVLVDPEGAQIDIPADFHAGSGFGKDPPYSVRNFLKKNRIGFEGLLGMNRRMRYTEYFIAPGDRIYALGTAADNPYVEESASAFSSADIMVQKGKNSDFYYISDSPEKDIVKKFAWKVYGGLFGGALLIVFCLSVIFIYLGVF